MYRGALGEKEKNKILKKKKKTKTIEEIKEMSRFFKQISTIDKPRAKLMKKKGQMTQRQYQG